MPTLKEQYAKEQAEYFYKLLESPAYQPNDSWGAGSKAHYETLRQQANPQYWMSQEYSPQELLSLVRNPDQASDLAEQRHIAFPQSFPAPPAAPTVVANPYLNAIQSISPAAPTAFGAIPGMGGGSGIPVLGGGASATAPYQLVAAPPVTYGMPGGTAIIAPGSGGSTPSAASQAILAARPDLLVNWQVSHDPAWVAAHPESASAVEVISRYPTLDAYLDADSKGYPPITPSAPAGQSIIEEMGQDGVMRRFQVNPDGTRNLIPGNMSGMTSGLQNGGAPVRADLQQNWDRAQITPFGQEAIINYIKSFPTIQDYLAADTAGYKDWATRSQATSVVPVASAGGATVVNPVNGGGGGGAAGGLVWNPSGGGAGGSGAANTAAALNAARTAYQSSPGAMGNYSDEAFLQWWAQNAASSNIEQFPADFALLTALADTGNPQALQVLDSAGYENTSPTQNLPIEQGLLDMALPGLLGDVQGDASRRQMVDALSGTAVGDYNSARQALSPEANAARLAAELAQADQTTGAVSASAATAATEQLAALQTSVAAMQQNLTGDLAAKAAALQQQVAAFTQNLNQFDATQKAALAEQIATTQKDLETSVAAQRNALTAEITALRGAADANSLARKAALQAEIAGLTAAQAPMAKARLDSAQALSTAVNLGLEVTNDALTAQRAKQGYLGSSSFSDANLARAAIGARQQAAGVMGGAREANAADLRTIQSRGATEGRTLADEYANNLLTLSGREATGGRTLADVLAQGTQQIGDTGAAGLATIKSNTGGSLMNVGNAGATQSYQDKIGGSSQLKALLDSLATGSAGIAGQRATQQQAARNLGTQAKQGYFDNAYTRQVAGQLAQPGLSTGLTNTLTQLGNYGNTGLNRTLGALQWWQTNPGTPPTPEGTAALVDSSGNSIAGLGAGLLGSAFSAANANRWWQTPATTAPPATDIWSGGGD